MSELNIESYDHYIVAFSGGKDSLACVLNLLEIGIPKAKIELWHHDIDGHGAVRFMDWPVTTDYCRKVAQALEIPIFFSWREGGFKREMLRDNTATARTCFETPDGLKYAGGKGKPGTRLKFPQVSADLSVRWCSAYLKIDVGSISLRNQKRFNGKRTLFITGERAEESAARAKYSEFEPHRTHSNKRHVDQWRPVHHWSESEVWNIIKRWNINPHPAYKLGWGRLSCALCIFGNSNQWASARDVLPEQFNAVADYEQSFGLTIKRDKSVIESANAGTCYIFDQDEVKQATSEIYTDSPIIKKWTMPQGAFGDSTGPT